MLHFRFESQACGEEVYILQDLILNNVVYKIKIRRRGYIVLSSRLEKFNANIIYKNN